MPSPPGSPDTLPVSVRSSPLLGATGLLTSPMPPFTGPTELLTGSTELFREPTVPFPARLLDQAMPRLSDTEWRLLCVVVRQTLGWYDKETGGRKEQDWLTQSQLSARTGRSGRAVSEAVAALTAQQVIRVLSDGGVALLTPEERRGYGGRHWFQMHPKWRDRLTADAGDGEGRPPAMRGSCEDTARPDGPCDNFAHGGSDNSAYGSRLWQEACDVFAVTKDHTTKETDYKYKTQKKNGIENRNGERVGKVYTEKPHKENKRLVPGRDFERSLREQRQRNGQQESLPKENMQRAGASGGRTGTALTIYGPSTPQVRAAWEQEAAGQRWAWRKDLKQWVKANEQANEEKGAEEEDTSFQQVR